MKSQWASAPRAGVSESYITFNALLINLAVDLEDEVFVDEEAAGSGVQNEKRNDPSIEQKEVDSSDSIATTEIPEARPQTILQRPTPSLAKLSTYQETYQRRTGLTRSLSQAPFPTATPHARKQPISSYQKLLEQKRRLDAQLAQLLDQTRRAEYEHTRFLLQIEDLRSYNADLVDENRRLRLRIDELVAGPDSSATSPLSRAWDIFGS